MTHSDQSRKRQPSKAAKQRVRDAFDPGALQEICTTWDFSRYAQRVDLPDSIRGRERFYYFQDNGSDILGIAHLDSVQDDGYCTVADTAAGLLAVSGTLDDRLGAYVILEMLPKLGITCDWLLTTDEEIAASTAEDFFSDKTYNWMFQFDRGGTDVVMYEYETKQLVGLVEDAGARVGNGSFSDICLLSHLGCAGFNWGVGYQDYHSARSHAWLEDTFRMVARFVKFYMANATLSFPYDGDGWGGGRGVRGISGAGADELDDDMSNWWARGELVVVDCGHAADLDDPTTYMEFEGGSVVVCMSCGTIPSVDQEGTG